MNWINVSHYQVSYVWIINDIDQMYPYPMINITTTYFPVIIADFRSQIAAGLTTFINEFENAVNWYANERHWPDGRMRTGTTQITRSAFNITDIFRSKAQRSRRPSHSSIHSHHSPWNHLTNYEFVSRVLGVRERERESWVRYQWQSHTKTLWPRAAYVQAYRWSCMAAIDNNGLAIGLA